MEASGVPGSISRGTLPPPGAGRLAATSGDRRGRSRRGRRARGGVGRLSAAARGARAGAGAARRCGRAPEGILVVRVAVVVPATGVVCHLEPWDESSRLGVAFVRQASPSELVADAVSARALAHRRRARIALATGPALRVAILGDGEVLQRAENARVLTAGAALVECRGARLGNGLHFLAFLAGAPRCRGTHAAVPAVAECQLQIADAVFRRGRVEPARLQIAVARAHAVQRDRAATGRDREPAVRAVLAALASTVDAGADRASDFLLADPERLAGFDQIRGVVAGGDAGLSRLRPGWCRGQYQEHGRSRDPSPASAPGTGARRGHAISPAGCFGGRQVSGSAGERNPARGDPTAPRSRCSRSPRPRRCRRRRDRPGTCLPSRRCASGSARASPACRHRTSR